jgi:uncharacterized protein YecE (DUF72 family)
VTRHATSSRQPARAARVRVGCSGWNYKSWRTTFYPAGLPASEWLAYYAAHFETVEINNSFYRLPDKSVFATWRRTVPSRFTFAVKASRYLTHMKRLRDPGEPVARLFAEARGLGATLGPVLYQLPPNLHLDIPRLSDFLATLPHRVRHVVEFRHPSWYVDATFACLASHGVAMCLHDKRGSAVAQPFAGPFVYVRFHGPSGEYHGGYSTQQLARWAHMLAGAVRDGRDVYAYFNNDPNAEAVRNALLLRSLVDEALEEPVHSERGRRTLGHTSLRRNAVT